MKLWCALFLIFTRTSRASASSVKCKWNTQRRFLPLRCAVIHSQWTPHVSAALLTITKAFRPGGDNTYDSILLSGEISLLGVWLSPSIAWSLESSMGLPLPYKAAAHGMAPWQSLGIYSGEWGWASDWALFEVLLKCAFVCCQKLEPVLLWTASFYPCFFIFFKII